MKGWKCDNCGVFFSDRDREKHYVLEFPRRAIDAKEERIYCSSCSSKIKKCLNKNSLL